MGICRVQVSACSCSSLATSAKLLSSVIAFIKLACWALLSAKSSGCQVLADSTIVAVSSKVNLCSFTVNGISAADGITLGDSKIYFSTVQMSLRGRQAEAIPKGDAVSHFTRCFNSKGDCHAAKEQSGGSQQHQFTRCTVERNI
jgi:hypothetical protein